MKGDGSMMSDDFANFGVHGFGGAENPDDGDGAGQRALAILENLRGDADLNTSEGAISVDHSCPDFPVIRLVRALGGGSAPATPGIPGVYELVRGGTDETPTYSLTNCYYEVSGVLRTGPGATYTLSSLANKVLGLRIVSSSGSGVTVSLQLYSSISDIANDMSDQTRVVMPLYMFDGDGDVACDLRHIPRADMWSLRV